MAEKPTPAAQPRLGGLEHRPPRRMGRLFLIKAATPDHLQQGIEQFRAIAKRRLAVYLPINGVGALDKPRLTSRNAILGSIGHVHGLFIAISGSALLNVNASR
ncbi:hypothetical protein GOB02_28985 [Sinorhizobium meliloti]|nr:hypothetical protein [Sinorhizobium meliloti]